MISNSASSVLDMLVSLNVFHVVSALQSIVTFVFVIVRSDVFLSFISAIFSLATFAFHIPSACRKKFAFNYGQILEMEPSSNLITTILALKLITFFQFAASECC